MAMPFSLCVPGILCITAIKLKDARRLLPADSVVQSGGTDDGLLVELKNVEST